MKQRKLLPYLITIVFFSFIYLLTMVFPLERIYNARHMFDGYKIPLQWDIFSFLLPGAIFFVNTLEIITTNNSPFFVRLLKSILTVIVTYAIAYVIFILLDIKAWNLYWHHRGAPAKVLIAISLMLTVAGISILEITTKIILVFFDKSLIKKYIPIWLWLEKSSQHGNSDAKSRILAFKSSNSRQ